MHVWLNDKAVSKQFATMFFRTLVQFPPEIDLPTNYPYDQESHKTHDNTKVYALTSTNHFNSK